MSFLDRQNGESEPAVNVSFSMLSYTFEANTRRKVLQLRSLKFVDVFCP